MIPFLAFFVGVLCGRSAWFMKKMRKLNVAEARANAAARSAATSTATGGSVVLVQGPAPGSINEAALGAAHARGLAGVPDHSLSAGTWQPVVYGGQEMTRQELVELFEDDCS